MRRKYQFNMHLQIPCDSYLLFLLNYALTKTYFNLVCFDWVLLNFPPTKRIFNEYFLIVLVSYTLRSKLNKKNCVHTFRYSYFVTKLELKIFSQEMLISHRIRSKFRTFSSADQRVFYEKIKSQFKIALSSQFSPIENLKLKFTIFILNS